MGKHALILVLPLLSGAPLWLAAAATAAGGPSGTAGATQVQGPPEALPPCDGVLTVKLRPLAPGQRQSDIDAVSCDHPAPGQPDDPGAPAWAGAPADPAVPDLTPGVNVKASFSRTRAPGKARQVKARTGRVYREAATGALIGQDFDLTSYRTLLVQWTGSSSGCTTGQSYAVPNVGSTLNDRIESSRSFSGCTRNYHYQNTSYTGSLQPCGTACGTLGGLNNQTSSIRWSR